MKKFVLLIVFCLAFAACGRSGVESDSVEALEYSEPQQAESEIISESVQETIEEPDNIPAGEPVIAPDEAPDPFVTYESGIFGVKFQFDDLPVWDFFGYNFSTPDTSLMWHGHSIFMDRLQFHISLEIAMGTTHPRGWQAKYGGGEPFGGGRMTWEQPDEPAEVFVTQNGLTVVKYVHIYDTWHWRDDGDTHNTTVLFMFREDGRDYREIEGTQIFYLVMLDVPSFALDDYYYDARAVVESFRFLEGAEISLQPTDEARAIGITTTNFPRINGSTSTAPLTGHIINAMFQETAERTSRGYFPWRQSRTIPSYELLLAGYADMILVPDPSAHVLALAEAVGVELEFIPIAAEALVFITSADNPVDNITLEQVRQIYTDMSITNWAELGGNDGRILPLNRNPHSGSQAQMDNLVLEGRAVHPDLARWEVVAMSDMLGDTMYAHRNVPDSFALGYTMYFYLQQMADWAAERIKTLSLDGVAPSHETILSGEYPLATNYFAVIRADSPENSPERIIADWLLTPAGQDTVEAAQLGRL